VIRRTIWRSQGASFRPAALAACSARAHVGTNREVEGVHAAVRLALIGRCRRPVGQAPPHDVTQDRRLRRRVQAGHEADTGPRLGGVLIRRPHGAPSLTPVDDAA
jgi:hypothetical protein